MFDVKSFISHLCEIILNLAFGLSVLQKGVSSLVLSVGMKEQFAPETSPADRHEHDNACTGASWSSLHQQPFHCHELPAII